MIWIDTCPPNHDMSITIDDTENTRWDVTSEIDVILALLLRRDFFMRGTLSKMTLSLRRAFLNASAIAL
jgi:hypothetical protein